MAGSIWCLLGALVIAAPQLIGDAATAVAGIPWQPPTAEFLLGTDGLGRDVLLRTLAGGQPFVMWPIIAGVVTTTLGAVIGLTATRVRWLDQALVWLSPALISLPGIVVSLALVQAVPATVATLITMVLLGAPLSARVLRAAAEPIRTSGAVEAAALRGESWWSIVWRDVRPAMAGAVLGDGLSRTIAALHVLVGLHVIGYGPPPPTPDWAVMVKDGAAGVMLSPWPMLAPAVALALLATSLAVVGELIGRPQGNQPTRGRRRRSSRRLAQTRGAGQLSQDRLMVRNTVVRYTDGPDLMIPEFGITAGSVTAVVGLSGAGKSTLLSVLADTLPDTATVTAAVADADQLVTRAGRIAVAEQQPHATLARHVPVWRAVADGRRISRQRVADTLADMGLPSHLRTVACRHLSGGQATRVAVARAIVDPPDVLVLDEPTAGLDATSAEIVGKVLTCQADRGLAVVVTSHDADWVARYCDAVVTVADGVVTAPQPVTAPTDGVRQAGPAVQVATRPAIGSDLVDHTPATLAGMASVVAAEQAMGTDNPISDTDQKTAALAVNQLCIGVPYGALARPHSLVVPAGQLVAVVGESGIGKTTLLRAIMGLTPYASGSVTLLGEHLLPATSGDVAPRTSQQRRHLQWVAQDSRLAVTPSETVLTAVLRAARTWHGAAATTASHQALHQVALPEDMWHRRVGQCSGGQRQRVCWARALVAQPKVLVMDEPTSALDAATTTRVLDVLRTMQRDGTAVLVATHDPHVVAAADQHIRVATG